MTADERGLDLYDESTDVYRGLDMMLPGVVSDTARAQGTWTSVPNPRFFTDGIGAAAGRDWPLA